MLSTPLGIGIYTTPPPYHGGNFHSFLPREFISNLRVNTSTHSPPISISKYTVNNLRIEFVASVFFLCHHHVFISAHYYPLPCNHIIHIPILTCECPNFTIMTEPFLYVLIISLIFSSLSPTRDIYIVGCLGIFILHTSSLSMFNKPTIDHGTL